MTGAARDGTIDQAENASVVGICFLLEQHLGHRTYAQNLRSAVESRSDIAAEWVEIDYAPDGAWWTPLPLPDRIRGALGGRRQVRHGLRASEASVNVFNTQVPAALGGALARRKPYVAVTDVTPRQYDSIADDYEHRADREGFVSRWKHHVNRRVYSEARACVAWSSWAADSIVSDYGVPAERVEVIAPGVELDRWAVGPAREDDSVRLLFVGGDFRRKGGDLLLDALAALPDEVELTVVTKSDVAPGPRVSVVDDLAPNDGRLRDLYASSDIFVLPSRAEAYGIAAVEAAASGLPSVVSDVGGLADIVEDGTTGFVVPAGGLQPLADGIRALVADASLRRRLGSAARERAEARFDATANANRLLDLARGAGR